MKLLFVVAVLMSFSIYASANIPFSYSEGFRSDLEHTRVVVPTERGDADPRNDYVLALLKLALEATETKYGHWSIAYSADDDNNTQSRNINMLASGNHPLNLIWVMTDRNKESLLKPVRVPIFKGIIGYRVCLVAKGNAEKFKQVRDVPGFIDGKFTIGQGHDWPDTKILSSNGFNVTTSANYDSLFMMLERKRFDCFLRGMNEVFFEMSMRPSLELDYHLAIYYPSPAYFFVNIDDNKLHERLNVGLFQAVQNGSFDELFSRYYDETINKIRLQKRHILNLNNPLLPERTPLDNPTLWYQVTDKQKTN